MRRDRNGTDWPSAAAECAPRTPMAVWLDGRPGGKGPGWHALPAWKVHCMECGAKYSRVTWRFVDVIEGAPQLECGACGALINIWVDRPDD